MRKKLTAFVLAAALAASLTGCGKADPAPQAGSSNPAGNPAAAEAEPVIAMGRWVEQTVDLSAFAAYPYYGPVLMEDGSLMMWLGGDGSGAAAVSTDNGVTWAETDPGFGDVDGSCHVLAAAPDGTLFFASRQGMETQSTEQYWVRRPGAAPQAVDCSPIPDFDSFGTGTFLDNDTLLLFPNVMSGDIGDGHVYGGLSAAAWLLDADDGSLKPFEYDTSVYPNISSAAFAACDGGARFLHYDGSLNTLTREGDIITDEAGPFNTSSGYALTVDADGNTYIASPDGIARLTPGGTLPEMLVEGLGTTLSLEGAYIRSLCRAADGSFFVTVDAMFSGLRDPVQLCRYYFDETLPTLGDGGIEVWTLFENATARQAVNVFAQEHPDVNVTLTVGVPDQELMPVFGRSADETAAASDALAALNTALLAGSGPDVLLLDGAAYENYARRGLLADIRGAVPLDALSENLAAPFVEADGSIYVMPARFSAFVILADDGDTADLASLDTLQAAILAGAPRPADEPEYGNYYTPLDPKYALDFASADSMGDYLLYTGAAAMLHDGALDAVALQRAFAFAQAVGEHYGMAAYGEEMKNGSSSGMAGQDSVTAWPRSEKYLTSDRARWGWELMQTPALASYHRVAGGMLSGSREKVPSTLAPAPGLSPGAWLPGTLAAVNAASADQQTAMDFVTVLFSAGVQDVYCQDGMPVRAESLAASIERNLGKEQNFTGDIAALVAGLQTPVTVPQVLETSFKAHLNALLAGREDASAAAAGVQSDLALYLAEQQ